MKGKDKTFLATASVAIGTIVATCGLGSCSQENKSKPVNIIHIMTDDHSFQTISAYGHPISQIARTPNIDRMANEGMLFTHAFVENSISAPSRATLLTGKYSHNHGQRTLDKGFDPQQTVFVEKLQEAGYQTAVIGKWHLNMEPKGFDYYKILDDQGDYYNPEFKSSETKGEYIKKEGYATTLITDYSLDWLEQRDPNRPFCLLLHHKAPHRNWMPETKYLNLYDEVEIPYPETLFDDYSTRTSPASTQQMMIANDLTMGYDLKVDQLNEQEKIGWLKEEWIKSLDRMTAEQREAWDKAYNPKNEAFLEANLTGDELTKWKYQRYLKDYLRVIKSVDDQVGRVLDYLDEKGLTENTIVVYTSDQGFYMGEHGWFDKRFMYEESFRTPLIVRWPAAIEPGSVCDELVQNIDFAPTYLDVANAETYEMDGVSLKPLFDGKSPSDWRDVIYYQYYDYPAIHMVHKHYGVRSKTHKLIHFYSTDVEEGHKRYVDSWELYDLKSDSTEVNNVYGIVEYEEIQKELKDKLVKLRNELGNPK